MSKSTDDIDEIYQRIKNWPGYIENWLKTMQGECRSRARMAMAEPQGFL